MMDLKKLLEKYGDIIKEEVNVKQLDILPEDMKIEKKYVPIGSIISKKFGKDTGAIIKFAKLGNVKELENGKILVYDDKNDKQWVLEKDDYQVRFEGLDEKTMVAEENVVVRLDLNITEDLKKEGVAREISRFLNQMRKEADYNVSDRVELYYFTLDDFLNRVIKEFEDFLKSEVLLKKIEKLNDENFISKYDIFKEFISEDGKVKFYLVRN